MKVVKKGYSSEQKKITLSREIESLKALDHPNIVELHEVINDANNQNIFMIMQYLEGPDIETLSGNQIQMKKWASQLISALFTCHE